MVTANFIIPALIGNGLWKGIATLLTDYWPFVVFGLVLGLFPILVGLAIRIIKEAKAV